ncbi:MAG: hypothetical protein EOP83_15880, partial [Verrucomicrobiaceae bacterium]
CVGGANYVNSVAHDNATIFSLRDDKNKPHVTIEMQGRTGRWTLNQVKGKSNKPPVAKYAPYVKAFLNQEGVTASSTGHTDVRGLGLYRNDNRYGSLEEVGARVGATFKNGDKLMVAEFTPTSNRFSGRITLAYTQKDGSHPFQITIKGEVSENGEHVNQGTLDGFAINRDDPSRYAAWAANLKEYLEREQLPPETREMEKIGLYYNAKTKTYGSLDEVSEKIWSKGSIIAHGLTLAVENTYGGRQSGSTYYETIFADKAGIPLLIMKSFRVPGPRDWHPSAISTPNANTAKGNLPALLVEFFTAMRASYPDDNERRATLRRFGVFENRGEWMTAAEIKKSVFENKNGSIRAAGVFVYVVDAKNSVMASFGVSNNRISGNPHRADVRWIDEPRKLDVMKLFADYCKQPEVTYTFANFSDRNFIEMGYVDRGGKIVSVAEISKTFKVKGHTVEIKVDPNGSEYTVDAGGSVVRVTADGDKKITHVNAPAGMAVYVPMIMKGAGLTVRRANLIGFGLKEVNGKAVAMDPKRDADLIGYAEGKIDLGNGLKWERNYSARPDHDYGKLRTRNHVPSPAGEIKSNGYEELARIEANDPEKSRDDKYTVEFEYNDPSIKMRKRLPDGFTREQVYKACMQFMKTFHDKVLPLEEDDQAYIGA